MFPATRLSKRSIFFNQLCGLVLTLLTVTACSKSPVTHRPQFNLVPDPLMRPLGEAAYHEMLSNKRLDRDSADHKRLKSVGKRIAKVANKDPYRWRFTLIKDPGTINAWCLPGGKIAFYSGILPVLENEAGMAFVMGHEVGHAVAHHGAERMSQQFAILGGLAALYLFLDKRTEMPEQQRNMLLAVLGVGAEVGIQLPFSRHHEREADIIGMMYMARAGYPPDESIKVWDRMRRATGHRVLPVFLSTHPTYKKRKENLRDWLRNTNKRYRRNKLDRDTRETLWH